MITVDYLKDKFGLEDDKELADKLKRSPGAVANWRIKGKVPATIELLAREMLGINQAVVDVMIDTDSKLVSSEMGTLCEALEDDQLMLLMVKDMMGLDEAERAQAYADFKMKWKTKKTTVE